MTDKKDEYTPDKIIKEGIKRIEVQLHDGMQGHATTTLTSTISSINRYYKIRRIKENIDDINTINLAIAETRMFYNVENDMLVNIRNILDKRKSTLLNELEKA